MIGPEIEELMRLLARLPGLGPRSARRIALHLLTHRDALMHPLAEALVASADAIMPCSRCGNLDTTDPCGICRDPARDPSALCVVEQVGDLWALERTRVFRGRYHVLGGTLSALDGVGPDDLRIAELIERAGAPEIGEVIIALEGSLAPIACLDDPESCKTAATCSLKPVWQEVEAATVRVLESITIADIAERERAGNVARYAI